MNRTQEEVIKIFEEKQQNAEMAYKRAVHNKDVTDKICNKAYMEAYEDCIALLRGCTIVESKPNQALSEEANEVLKPKADITKDKLEGVWVLYSGVITEKDGNVYVDDGTKVYCFPKYSTTRDKDLKYFYQEKKPSEIVGADLPHKNIPTSDSMDREIADLTTDNKRLVIAITKLEKELAQCKETIVELANQNTHLIQLQKNRGNYD